MAQRTNNKTRRIAALTLIICFTGLMGLAVFSMGPGNNHHIPEPAPDFTRAEFSKSDLQGHISLINFFASWCVPCEVENDVLLDLKNNHGLTIYGINYKDSDSGRRDYLQRLGNPYTAITADKDGSFAALWGTHAVPETLIVDENGIIRYRHAAPLMPDDIDTVIIPAIRQIQQD